MMFTSFLRLRSRSCYIHRVHSEIMETNRISRCLRTFSDQVLIRLSKRMSELDLASRNEADRLITDGKVIVKGEVARLGQKVDPNETDIAIENEGAEIKIPAVVLNKPLGFVSGQPEDGHTPAIKLLIEQNLVQGFSMDSTLHKNMMGFVPAGRLDLESTGLLIFSQSGVMAKKLVSNSGKIEKEYIVSVQPAHQVTRYEREKGITSLPSPNLNLSILTRGGARLFGDSRVLKPVRSKWLIPGEKLQLILKEGRKHQIRRMMRELLGFHTVELERVRVGPVTIKNIPPGKWRPLKKSEVDVIMGSPNK